MRETLIEFYRLGLGIYESSYEKILTSNTAINTRKKEKRNEVRTIKIRPLPGFY